MRAMRPGLILLFVQLLLVLSVAGKYLYDRQTRPRVWTEATVVDPALPVRGRYLGLRLLVNACGLPRDAARTFPQYYGCPAVWQWNVSLNAVNGNLMPSVSSRSRETLTVVEGKVCDRAPLSSEELLFVPDRAPLPFPLEPHQHLWVEVTVPASGPPRPIRMDISTGGGFHHPS
jgi:hypothetical protein